jgi:hypothetical protein
MIKHKNASNYKYHVVGPVYKTVYISASLGGYIATYTITVSTTNEK